MGSKPKKRWRPVLVGVAAGAVAAAATLRQTRGMPQASRAPEPGSRRDRAAKARVLAEHPADLELQIGGATDVPDVPDTIIAPNRYPAVIIGENLRALEARFPNAPAVYANELRYMMCGEVTLRRWEEQKTLYSPEEQAEYAAQWLTTKWPDDTPEQRARLAQFDRAAAEGERLDPENAYFPLVRAVGLFQARQDDAAIAALHRAAERTQWREYYQEEIDGQQRLIKMAVGEREAQAWRRQAAVLLPHLSQIRALMRLAIAQAITVEQAGRTEDGLALRRDVLRIGGLLRTEATLPPGVFTGIACAMLATIRPGGATANYHGYHHSPSASEEEANRQRYYAYLRGIGANDEAQFAEAELDAGRQTKAKLLAGPKNE